MIQPQLAPVRPRVVRADGDEQPLDDEVRQHIDRGGSGTIALVGPPGSGKSTALRHLAAVFAGDARLGLLDAGDAAAVELLADDAVVFDQFGVNRLVVHVATAAPSGGPHLAAYRMAPWARDDLIEYLLARHREKCAAVMKRVCGNDLDLFQGVAELWAVILDQLAADESIPDVRAALLRFLEQQLPDTDAVYRARTACLNLMTAAEPLDGAAVGFPPALTQVLRHRAVQVVLAAERIVSDLHEECDCDFLACRLPRDLVRAAARLLPPGDRAIDRLRELVAGPPWRQSMSASLLHATHAGWEPAGLVAPELLGAYLEGAVWPGVKLADAQLSGADLSAADLSGADLTGVAAVTTGLRRARLGGATLHRVRAIGADLTGAVLTAARGSCATFDEADLTSANLEDALLLAASFVSAALKGTNFAGADLRRARFGEAEIEDADFIAARLDGANLSGLKLRGCRFHSAILAKANLSDCDLEDIDFGPAEFRAADLTRALLTATTVRHAVLDGACLRETGLGDVDWEYCSLRDADLTGATFHMGSTRSGLVGSPIACEGSRTGFYTDDYDDRSFKDPKEIRKAALCGTDLRGATIDKVDFYLVDLRGAVYDRDQADHFRRCGAILGPYE